MAFSLFKSTRNKVMGRYKQLFEPVPVYGAVFTHFLTCHEGGHANCFRRDYDRWRKMALQLVEEGEMRDEATVLMDAIFQTATRSDELIEKIDDEKAEKCHQRLLVNIEGLQDILRKSNLT